MPRFVPTTQEALLELIAERTRAMPDHAVVAIDGADAGHPVEFARRGADAIRAVGLRAEVVALHDYVRPAALRLEYGQDETAYRTAWFDYAAIRREVVDAMHHRGQWLPTLWNEHTDRSARDTIRTAQRGTTILVAGPMLLGRGLDFDLRVHLDLSAAALHRHTPDAQRWTIQALLDHDAETSESPDYFVRWDHPDRPALRML